MKSPLFTNNQEDIEKVNAHEATQSKSECCGAEISWQVGALPNTKISVCSACQMVVHPRESSGEEKMCECGKYPLRLQHICYKGKVYPPFSASTHKTCTLDEDGNCEECGKTASTDTECCYQRIQDAYEAGRQSAFKEMSDNAD